MLMITLLAQRKRGLSVTAGDTLKKMCPVQVKIKNAVVSLSPHPSPHHININVKDAAFSHRLKLEKSM